MRGKRRNVRKPGARSPGRPSKMSEEISKIILQCLSEGLHFKTACGIAMITDQTFYNWCDKFPDFLAKVNYARATAILVLNRKVKETDPKFIMKNLEPSLYRDRIETELTGNATAPIRVIVEDLRIEPPKDDENGKEEKTP